MSRSTHIILAFASALIIMLTVRTDAEESSSSGSASENAAAVSPNGMAPYKIAGIDQNGL